ncbi:MAG: septal ring lytic transglycosylase RlpA family protein [Actinomycetota bacterium]|nr:septal ring lytic transglycosylase RlpA family protein [Actinomycetota bacterium]
MLSLGASALGLPALAFAGSGGASLTGGSSSSSSRSGGAKGNLPGHVRSGNVTVSASGSGISLVTHASAMLGNQMRFTGSLASSAAGKIVEIERQGHQTGRTWQPTAHGTKASDGSFAAVWNVSHIGQFRIRAVIENTPGVRPHGAAMSPSLTVTVYRPSLATQYGPGFYGQKTACGQTLRGHTIGVANRTLPCGTPVAVYYRGRTLIVPVIDRGPYANGADWDLTEAAGQALGIAGTAKIGAVSLPGK